jgi:hypothetical protein
MNGLMNGFLVPTHVLSDKFEVACMVRRVVVSPDALGAGGAVITEDHHGLRWFCVGPVSINVNRIFREYKSSLPFSEILLDLVITTQEPILRWCAASYTRTHCSRMFVLIGGRAM